MGGDSGRLTRAADLEVYEAEDGLLVFHPATDRVHHLNATASVVFELCNGATQRAELPGLVARLFSLEGPPREVVESVLQELVGHGVLIEVRGDVAD
jgi:hypothetical protein